MSQNKQRCTALKEGLKGWYLDEGVVTRCVTYVLCKKHDADADCVGPFNQSAPVWYQKCLRAADGYYIGSDGKVADRCSTQGVQCKTHDPDAACVGDNKQRCTELVDGLGNWYSLVSGVVNKTCRTEIAKCSDIEDMAICTEFYDRKGSQAKPFQTCAVTNTASGQGCAATAGNSKNDNGYESCCRQLTDNCGQLSVGAHYFCDSSYQLNDGKYSRCQFNKEATKCAAVLNDVSNQAKWDDGVGGCSSRRLLRSVKHALFSVHRNDDFKIGSSLTGGTQ